MNNDNIRTGLLAAALGGLLLATLLYGCGDSQPSQAEDDVRQAALASEHSPTLGPPDAKVHIVEFLDPACGTCALFYPMVKGWMADIPDEIRLSVRHVAFHDGVDYAVRVLEASRNQGKYWETLETLLASQRQWVNNHIVQPDSVLPALAGVGLDMDQLQAAGLESAEGRRDAGILRQRPAAAQFRAGAAGEPGS
jgi:hypothetical protein